MNKWSLVFLVLCVSAVLAQEENVENEAQYASMRRTACLVLSRYHSNTQKDTIEGVVQGLSPENQQLYINKIYSTAVQTCEPLINQSEVQELFVENPDFDPVHLFHVFETVDYAAVAENLDTPLTPNQENIVKFIKQFDEEMAIRKEEKEAEQGASKGAEDNEIKMFGISFHKMSGFTKFLYAAVFFGLVGSGLWWGFQRLDGGKDTKKNQKRKKSPKKD